MRPSVLLLLLAGLSASPALADESATFDLSIRGIYVGTVSYSGQVANGRYAVSGKLQSGGIVDWVKHISYDGTSNGRVSGDRFTPQRYVESADTGQRQSQAVMEYRGGVPQLKRYNPPRPPGGDNGVDPATQGGTVDPLTALFAALRDVPPDEACNLTLKLFDGKRASQVKIGAPQADGNGVVCAGEYRRVAGYSEADMAEKTRFPFRLSMAPTQSGTLQVAEISMDTIYGKGRMKRR